jgi:hypothetical protein
MVRRKGIEVSRRGSISARPKVHKKGRRISQGRIV